MATPAITGAPKPSATTSRTLCYAAAAVTLLLLGQPASAYRGSATSQVPLPLDEGRVEVSIRPDGRSPLRLRSDSSGRWQLLDEAASLVGTPYTVVLHNRSPHRLKVVVGVDGVNVYRKTPLRGSAEGDIGSILAPWSRREIPGWQLDLGHAQRFVFSPADWSEGQGITDSQIGTLRVEVYHEVAPAWEIEYLDRKLGHEGRGQRHSEGNREGDSEDGRSVRPHRRPNEPSSADRSASSKSQERAAMEAPIGTTSGEDVSHRVRTVRFDSASDYPAARVLINYGRGASHYDRPQHDHLGLELIDSPRGSRVRWVAPGSTAAMAGLRQGDLILRIDTTSQPSPRTVRRVWKEKAVGRYVFLRVRREGVDLSFKIRST